MATCPRCGQDNPDGFSFCGFCSAALETKPHALERKIVSVLFVDLVGFTARSEALDPEDVKATLVPYHARLKTEIERFGGTVEKFVGDAVMAVFGAPVAHEDDAERAVRAALRITDAIADLNADHPSLELAIRGAVTTGEAVVSLDARPEAGEGIVAGDVVNTASRLQGVAPVGAIVVGEHTYASTNALIDYEPLDPVTVRGKAEPIPIYRAVAARSRYGVDVRVGYDTPFLGRDFELELLVRSFERTLKDDAVQLVTVSGEPGVGKSRLVSELARHVDDRPDLVRWRQGRCLPYGDGITFWALGEVIKAHCGILESDSVDDARAKLTATLADLIANDSDRAWLTARVAPLIGVSATDAAAAERGESFAAWRRFLEEIATRTPLVVVVEDLHWADKALLEFVEHLADWSTGVPLFILCTARPELFESHPGWGGGMRNATTISLAPLSDTDTKELVQALATRIDLPAEVTDEVIARSGGNPLYAEEFCRMVSDRGGWTDDDAAVPATVHALIAARLDTLDSDRKALLHDAAVVGKVFWSGALAAMGATDRLSVESALHELARKELVRPQRTSSVAGETEYSFWHALVRDVAYGEIPRAERAAKHVAAAQWIEQVGADRAIDQAELIAHHYTEAVSLQRVAGNDPGDLVITAVKWLIAAGDRASQLDAARAEVDYERALSLLPESSDLVAEVLLKLAEVKRLSGALSEAERLCHTAIEGFERVGNMRLAGDATLELARINWILGRAAEMTRLADIGTEVLERLPPSASLGRAYVSQAFDRLFHGRPIEAIEWADKAMSIAKEQNDARTQVDALNVRGCCRVELSDQGGLDEIREAIATGLKLGLAGETADCYNNLSTMLATVRGLAEALDAIEEGIAFAQARGLHGVVVAMIPNSADYLTEMGRWDEALELIDDSFPSQENEENVVGFTWASTHKAFILGWRGLNSEASRVAEEGLTLARLQDPQSLTAALSVAASTRLRAGLVHEAADLIEELEAVMREFPTSWRAFFIPDGIRVALAAEKPELAERLMQGLKPNSAREECALLSCCGLVAEYQRENEQSADFFDAAVTAWRSYGHVPETGLNLLGGGRLALLLGDGVGARERLLGALEIFSRLGAQPLIGETKGYLSKLN